LPNFFPSEGKDGNPAKERFFTTSSKGVPVLALGNAVPNKWARVGAKSFTATFRKTSLAGTPAP
jgi:hypothetical protein